MIITTHGLRLQSVKAMSDYLLKDLRIDFFSAIKSFDNEIIEQCLKFGRKKTELTQLLKFFLNE